MTLDFFRRRIIGGDFPEGSIILVAGEPGTGKTIFVSSYVYEELKKGKRVLFISLNETKEDYYSNMKKLGMNFDVENFKFVDLFTVTREAIDAQLNLIYEEIERFKPDIIVVDSITAITSVIGPEEVRAFLHVSLGKYVKSLGSTAILIAEKPTGREGLGFGVEEFVVDGLIILRYIKYGEHYRRVLEIPKMRGRKIEKPQYEYAITDKGIVFFDIPELERTEDLTFERVSTGIEKFDEMVGGGYLKGSITILAGHTGTGKTTFGLHFVYENALKGKKAVFLSFEESVENILRAMKEYGMDYNAVKDNLVIESMVPEAHSPVTFFVKIMELIDKVKPDVMFIDSFSSIQEHMDEEEMRKMVRYLQLTVKKYGIALCATLNVGGSLKDIPATNLSTLADNLIFLWYDIDGGEISRRMLVIKSRASNHSRKIYSFEIADRGIVIGGEVVE